LIPSSIFPTDQSSISIHSFCPIFSHLIPSIFSPIFIEPIFIFITIPPQKIGFPFTFSALLYCKKKHVVSARNASIKCKQMFHPKNGANFFLSPILAQNFQHQSQIVPSNHCCCQSILDSLLSSASTAPLSIEQFSRILSRAAFELRKICNNKKGEGEGGKNDKKKKAEMDEVEAEAIWRRIKLLIQVWPKKSLFLD
jgi:hypothetical protein